MGAVIPPFLFNSYKFEIFQDLNGQWRFHFVGPNGKIMAASEGYITKQSCEDTIQSIKQNAPNAQVVARK